MASANLLKQLIESHVRRDDDAFRRLVQDLIKDERKKRHHAVARELEEVLRSTPTAEAAPASRPKSNAGSPTPAELSGLLEVRPARYRLDDLVLEPVVIGLIERVIRDFEEVEKLEASGIRPLRVLLFCGPAGCGKSVTAEAVAGELGLPLVAVRSDAVAALTGETPRRFTALMDFIQSSPYLVLFDEFDAIGRSREEPHNMAGTDSRVLSIFLKTITAFKGPSLIIAATNRERALDPAVWDRFQEIIQFERPREAQLVMLVHKSLAPLEYEESHVADLARNLTNSSHSEVIRVCHDVRKSCVLRGSNRVNAQDLREAVARRLYRQSILQKIARAAAGSAAAG